MTPPRRRTVRERNLSAYADTAPALPETAPEPEQPEKPATRTQKKKQPPAPPTTEQEAVAVYIAQSRFNVAKSAYLADWADTIGDADTFARWVESVLLAHAARTPQGRAKLAAQITRAAEQRTDHDGKSVNRHFKIARNAKDTALDALNADRDHGRWLSESAWNVEAIEAAIARAEKRRDGTLPPAPPRLPNRLKR